MKLEDFTKTENRKEFVAHLYSFAKALRSIGKELFACENLGAGSYVYSAIAEATAAQLELLGRLSEEPIEITANICRTVFEINIVFRYCLSSTQRLEDYGAQSATDEISIYKSIKGAANKETSPDHIKAIDGHIEQIKNTLKLYGMPLKPERTSLFQMAKEVGMKEEYQNFYGIYSKYVHASAWFVINKREQIDLPPFRIAMHSKAQRYAVDTLKRLEELRDIVSE